MEANKLIAEFMGMKYSDERSFDNGEWTHSIKSLSKFQTSWDWLMPVVQKCFDTQQPEEGQHYFINESLLTMKIEVVYDRVVEFIKTYNNGRQ